MKLRTTLFALAMAVTPLAQAQSLATMPLPQSIPQSPETWLQRMADFSQNGSAFRDPRIFVPWVNAISEPSFYVTAMQGGMDPAVWLNMANSMADPAAVRNWLWVGDLGVYNKWLQASADPAFYTALAAQFSDPGKMMRWAMLPLDPKLWNVMLSTLNPNTYIRWGMAAMDPRAWNLMGNVANPALYTGMAGALVNPAFYGQANNPWLTWKPPAPVVGASNPWGGEQSASFNLFDPVGILGNLSAMAPSFSLPGLSQPSATPAPSLAPVPFPAAMPAPLAQAPVAMPAPTPAAEPAPAPKPPVQDSKIVLAGDTLFKSGKSSIKSLSKEGKESLDDVAAKLKSLGTIEQIRIVGHADVTGKAKANQKLSEQRAKSVKSYLVAKGVKPGLIITSGVGDTQPVVECDMGLPKAKLIECLAPNRRVEIEIQAKAK